MHLNGTPKIHSSNAYSDNNRSLYTYQTRAIHFRLVCNKRWHSTKDAIQSPFFTNNRMIIRLDRHASHCSLSSRARLPSLNRNLLFGYQNENVLPLAQNSNEQINNDDFCYKTNFTCARIHFSSPQNPQNARFIFYFSNWHWSSCTHIVHTQAYFLLRFEY